MTNLSTVTVVLNDKLGLQKTLHSIRSLSPKPAEVIVIDGCSDDGSIQVAQDNADIIDVYVSEKDNGIFDAMNKGIKLATSDYVHILNCGDVFHDSHVLNGLSDAPQKDFILYDVKRMKDNDDNWLWKAAYDSLYGGMRVSHVGLLVSRRIYEEKGTYDLQYKYISDAVFILKQVKQDNSLIMSKTLVTAAPAGFSSSVNFQNSKERLMLSFMYPTSIMNKSIIFAKTLISLLMRGFK